MAFKQGDFVSRVSYCEILGEGTLGSYVVKNEFGKEWTIDKEIAHAEMVSASDFVGTKKLTMTELATEFTYIQGGVFTVEFEKKDGSIRTLIGYKLRSNPVLGYSDVIDLQLSNDESKQYDTRQRKVYHERIKSFIHNSIKYQLK